MKAKQQPQIPQWLQITKEEIKQVGSVTFGIGTQAMIIPGYGVAMRSVCLNTLKPTDSSCSLSLLRLPGTKIVNYHYKRSGTFSHRTIEKAEGKKEIGTIEKVEIEKPKV